MIFLTIDAVIRHGLALWIYWVLQDAVQKVKQKFVNKYDMILLFYIDFQ